jgi:hypothetical protein
MQGYEAKVFDLDDGEELTVIEVDTQDSGDPDTLKFVVYAWRRDQ